VPPSRSRDFLQVRDNVFQTILHHTKLSMLTVQVADCVIAPKALCSLDAVLISIAATLSRRLHWPHKHWLSARIQILIDRLANGKTLESFFSAKVIIRFTDARYTQTN
jgi:hypothetical protein